MSVINDSIKQFLAEVEKFFHDTIKNEKLGKKAQEHKQLILDKLSKIFEENPYLRVSVQDTGKGKENQDESLFTGGSSKSDNSDENAYSDYGIPKIPASELKNPAFYGSLEKKQKKGSGLFGGPKFQTRWCVIHGGNFYYYIRNDDKKQVGCFKLAGYSFRSNPDITKQKKDKELAFELYNEDKARRVYQFVAHNKEEYEKVKMAIHYGGLIEESDELYEEVGKELDGTADEMYVEDVGISEGLGEPQEVYEEPDQATKSPEPPAPRPPTPPPPVVRGQSSKSGSALPPLPATPVPQKPAEPTEPEPPPIEEELYEEASSCAAVEKSTNVPPEKATDEAPPPPPPPTRGLPPQPPLPPATESPAHRRLPPTPVDPPKKKKIKLNIICKPEEDFENKYFGKWDCKGDNPNELTFRRGDIIHILSKEFDEKSWWIGELNGKFGLVPKTYLTPAYVAVA